MKRLFLLSLLVSAPAAAQDRDLCADRPGLGTPPCTVAPGHVTAELGLADWTLERDNHQRTDTLIAGDLLVRIGIAQPVELQIGLTGFGHQRTNDRMTNVADVADGVGDGLIGAKVNLLNPDGDRTSIAFETQVTLPVGRTPIGAGDWGVANVLPMSSGIGDKLALEVVPEVDAAVNESGHGRHVSWGGTAGVALDLTDKLTVAIEQQLIRDDEPTGRITHALAGLSLAWHRGPAMQFDAGINVGLNRNSDGVEVYTGISQHF